MKLQRRNLIKHLVYVAHIDSLLIHLNYLDMYTTDSNWALE